MGLRACGFSTLAGGGQDGPWGPPGAHFPGASSTPVHSPSCAICPTPLTPGRVPGLAGPWAHTPCLSCLCCCLLGSEVQGQKPAGQGSRWVGPMPLQGQDTTHSSARQRGSHLSWSSGGLASRISAVLKNVCRSLP